MHAFSKEDARFFKKGYMLFQKRVQAKITEQKELSSHTPYIL